MISLFTRVYAGLSSLKLTMVVLSVLAVALIYGTFYESANGTPMAHASVYASKWFDALLCLLFANMVACTAKRYPYKPHQLGFLMVHCGILTILTGAMLTRNFGRDGELFVNEGETRDTMTSTRPYLRVGVPQDGVEGFETPLVFPARAQGARVDRSIRLPRGPVRLRFTRYFPNARWTESVVEGPRENPAVQVRVATNHGEHEEAWLLPRDGRRRALEAAVRIEAVEAQAATADSLLAALSAARPRGRGDLVLRAAGRSLATIPLDGPVPRSVAAGPYEVRLREWFSHFVLHGDHVGNASAAMANPAIAFDVAGPRGTENHIAFAFHAAASLAPETDRGYDIQASYAFRGRAEEPPLVRLVHDPNGAWRIGANFDLDVPVDARVAPGQTLHAAASGIEVAILATLDRAEVRDELVNVDREERNPAVLVTAETGADKSEPTWLLFGDTRTVRAGDREVTLELGRRQMPLGFAVRLVDFQETTYPGTSRSATFASDVVVSDDTGEPVPIHISMNKPLKHRGFRLFQSSYVRDGGQEASIFSVSYDPGVTVVYTGFIIFIAGLVAIFYLKPVIRRAYAANGGSRKEGP